MSGITNDTATIDEYGDTRTVGLVNAFAISTGSLFKIGYGISFFWTSNNTESLTGS